MSPKLGGWCLATLIAAIGLFGIGVDSLNAQGATATVLGTVSDMLGAAVPDAAVQVKNVQTGAAQLAKSDPQGRFRVSELPIGNYELQASKEGFATLLHKGVALTVGSETVIDFALQVGQQQQTVTVEGLVSQVETTNAAIGSYTSQQQMSDLPLNGRNFEQLILLAPGVAPAASSPNAMQGRGQQYSVAGGRPEGQAILLDDQNLQNFWNNGMGSVTGSSLGVEAIAEFQTLTNSYGAQFGGNGAVINAVSKSGSNGFHGSAFDYLRNSALDARDFFSTIKAPPFRRNQFGGSLGGPIKKDKLFFFVDYEGIRQFLQVNKAYTVPACNLPGVCTPASSVNALTAQAIASTLALYPTPTQMITATTGIVQQYGNQIVHENYMLGRFDYNISEKDSVFGRYYMDRASYDEPFGGGSIGGGAAGLNWHELDGSASQFATLQERHVFSPTVVNVARVSFSRPTKDSHNTTIASLNGPVAIGTAPCGAVSYCAQTPLQFFPVIAGNYDGLVQFGSGITGLGAGQFTTFDLVQNRYSVGEDILWTRGAHSLRFGASLDRDQANTNNPLQRGASWTFSSLQAFLSGVAQTVTGVLPSPNNYSNRDYRQIAVNPYVQDDWKVSRKLTINMGVRGAFHTNPVVLRNGLYQIPNIATSTGFVKYDHIFDSNPSLHNFDPRIGIAYDPFADHKTSIRAGFGIFHNPIVGMAYQIGLQQNQPWLVSSVPNATYPNALSSGGTAALPSATQGWSPQNTTTPYMIQYNLNIQREIAPNTVLTLAYVGSRGVHLFSSIDLNPPVPTVTNGVLQFGSVVNGQYRANTRVNPNFGPYVTMKPLTTSRYNSMQVLLNRRLAQNLTAQMNYNYSRCLDIGAIGIPVLNGAPTPSNAYNPYDQNMDHGVCGHDITHVLRINGLYALPFHGNRAVSGWQITGIVSKYSGLPFTVANGANQVDPGGNSVRPNYVYGCDPYAGQTITQWFNPACYTTTAAGFLGNTGRNTLRGPGFFGVDVGILKDTKLTERVNLQFRAEAFNVLNHANFAPPPSPSPFTVNAAAGRIVSTAGNSTPRQIQFALKVLF